MLVVFKSAPILKRTLKVKHATMQLYVLKLLKMQTKYLGRQWRKSNMKTMSAIYQKVRHRLNDDWAYGNGQSLFRLGGRTRVPLFHKGLFPQSPLFAATAGDASHRAVMKRATIAHAASLWVTFSRG